ncbi:MAG: hypothetical protein MJ105_07290 [Lachnospiraceae bacterium]|nr:hypothetical protein [Lachnospiraceae bacterium]
MPTTIQTSCQDGFFLYSKVSSEVFWKAIECEDGEFETYARREISEVLVKSSKDNVLARTSGYMSHLRKVREFFRTFVPTPSIELVEYYLNNWEKLENYRLQEDALNRLFYELCPNNINISDVLLKVATLNDFYSTNIFSVYPVAKHILELNIDNRLENGDEALIDDIKAVVIGDKEKTSTPLQQSTVAIINRLIIRFMIAMLRKYSCIIRKRMDFHYSHCQI